MTEDTELLARLDERVKNIEKRLSSQERNQWALLGGTAFLVAQFVLSHVSVNARPTVQAVGHVVAKIGGIL